MNSNTQSPSSDKKSSSNTLKGLLADSLKMGQDIRDRKKTRQGGAFGGRKNKRDKKAGNLARGIVKTRTNFSERFR